MAFGDKGPTQGKEEFSTVSGSHPYSSRIVNCRDRGTVSQNGAPSHIWKHWLAMSNMSRPVDPRRSFDDLLKTCTCKYENTFSLLPATGKSKVITMSKAPVQQVVKKTSYSP